MVIPHEAVEGKRRTGMVMAKVLGFFGAVGMMPVIANLEATSALEKMGKGTTQVVLSVVVTVLALTLFQVLRLHRKDALDSRKELKDEFKRHAEEQKEDNEKLQQIIVDNTSAMNLLAKSDDQLKEAIYTLAKVVDNNGPAVEKIRKA